MQDLVSASTECRLSAHFLEPGGLRAALADDPLAADSLTLSTPWIMTSLRRSMGEVLMDQTRPRWRRWARAWHDRALRVSNSWPQ